MKQLQTYLNVFYKEKDCLIIGFLYLIVCRFECKIKKASMKILNFACVTVMMYVNVAENRTM